MKSDPLRLAWLFNEAGMIDEATFESFTQRRGPQAKSTIMDILKKDVSLRSIREIFTMDLTDITLVRKAPEKRPEPTLHSALSQAVHLSDAEIKSLLNAWKPSVAGLIGVLCEAGVIQDKPESAAAGLGKGAGVYGRMIEKGWLDSKILNQVAASASFPAKKMNRLLLALNFMRFNGILEPEDCDGILKTVQTHGPERTPQLNEQVIAFIDSEPDLPEIDLSEVDPPETLRRSLPVSVVRQSLLLPVQKSKGFLEIVNTDPFDVAMIDTLSLLTGVPVVAYYAPTPYLIRRIQEIFPQGAGEGAGAPQEPVAVPRLRTSAVAKAQTAAPAPLPGGGRVASARVEEPLPSPDDIVDNRSAVELVSSIVEGGIRHRATDVHLEPSDGGLRIRYRIDGRLRDVMRVPASLVLSVISRIKVLSNLDVTERRRPQDGHFSLKMGESAYDFRVSTLPTHSGEKTVIRILDASRVMYNLQGLGMEDDLCAMVHKWISRPHGLLLVTGPTGCGKTSTLYAALSTINGEEKNIVTIEDPVEYQLDGINQVQVDPNIELGFAQGLRSVLRQDPDVIMVGEIRDQETARIAMRAALTGHLVFSTLHTNTAVGAVATLGQMGIEPYMVVSAISGVVSQRLLRTLCPQCKEAFTPSKELLQNLRTFETKGRKRLFRAKGCDACLGTGYHGRTGVFELLPLSDPVCSAILARKSEAELTDVARQFGFISMLENALLKLHAGITSPEEVMEALIVEE